MEKNNIKKELKLTKKLKRILNKKASSQNMARAYNQYHEFILEGGIPSEKRKRDGFLYAPPGYKNLAETIILKLVPKKQRVLEMGIGDGRLSYKLALEKECKVIGIDISDVVIDLAKKRFKNEPNLIYKKADARRLPFKNESFDIAISKDLIEHLPSKDQKNHFTEVKRVLKNKGKYLIFTPPKLTPQKFKGLHLKEYSLKELLSTLENAGFSIVKTYWVQIMKLNLLMRLSKPLIGLINLYESFLEKTKSYKLFFGPLNKIFVPRFVVIAQK